MQYLLVMMLGFAGCTSQTTTEDDELALARAEKAKHPEHWRTPKKLTSTETTRQERKWLEIEREHLERRKKILAKHRHG